MLIIGIILIILIITFYPYNEKNLNKVDDSKYKEQEYWIKTFDILAKEHLRLFPSQSNKDHIELYKFKDRCQDKVDESELKDIFKLASRNKIYLNSIIGMTPANAFFLCFEAVTRGDSKLGTSERKRTVIKLSNDYQEMMNKID